MTDNADNLFLKYYHQPDSMTPVHRTYLMFDNLILLNINREDRTCEVEL
jgi:hypothetical protein